jgi:tRNA A-37 threonylcarbamoyl transferase component Bud32
MNLFMTLFNHGVCHEDVASRNILLSSRATYSESLGREVPELVLIDFAHSTVFLYPGKVGRDCLTDGPGRDCWPLNKMLTGCVPSPL